MLLIVLLLLPFFAYLSILFLYRYSGRKQFLHFDLVQFIYAFIIYPLIYVWLKNFLYFLLRSELGVHVSTTDWLLIDTCLSVIFLYVYGFGIIHSLTKTFALELERDPFFDLFSKSEYFHEVVSHIGIYVGALAVMCLLGIVNTLFPLGLAENKTVLYILLGVALFMGLLMNVGIFVITDIQSVKYKRIMHFTIGILFIIHALFYFIASPRFSISYMIYWFTFFIFSSAVLTGFFVTPTRRIGIFFTKRFKPQNGEDIEEIPIIGQDF